MFYAIHDHIMTGSVSLLSLKAGNFWRASGLGVIIKKQSAGRLLEKGEAGRV